MPLSELAQRILAEVPKSGWTVGNIWLIRKLAVTPELYYQARKELEDQKLILRGVGRGGTIRLANPVQEPAPPVRPGGVKNESDLYAPLKEYFDKNWGPDYQSPDFYACEITGSPKGHRRASGTWSRPDLSIVIIAGVEFFVPSKILEVTTVEAKRYEDIGVPAVFEAASHSKFGHQAYLAAEWLEDFQMDESPERDVQDVIKEARRFGIGLLQMKRDGAAWKVDEILEPVRKNPDPTDCSEFIEQIFEKYHKQLRGAMK